MDAAALDRALCLREKRVVGRDHCVSFEGRVLQLDPGRGLPSLAGKRVLIEQVPDGSLRVMWKGQAVPHRQITQRPNQAGSKPTLQERVATHEEPYKPPKGHPWRGPAVPRAAPAC